MKWTNKQQVFVEEYLKCWNATEAARRAGYSPKTARSIGSENLTKPDILAKIEQRKAELAMSADEVLLRLASHARGDLSPFLTPDGKEFDLSTDEARAHLPLVKRVKTTRRYYPKLDMEETAIEIELHDPQAALVHIGRHLKLFTDKLEVDDKGITDEQRLARITAILDKARTRRDRQADTAHLN